MFSSFLRRNKPEKPTEPPKLRGMPALKQMRSSKREVSLTTKPSPVLSNLSEIDRLRILGDEEVKHQSVIASYPSAETRKDYRSSEPVNTTRNYKRPKSPETSDRRQPNHIDRVSNGNRTSAIFYEEESTRFDGSIPEEDEDCVEGSDPSASKNTSWRMSKGDSGYKSKDESRKSSSSAKKPHRKKSNFNKPLATTGLHVVKQQRKASRESVSKSMRALTPRERESIRCLDDVLKNHPDGDESFDEVFNSESSENDIEEEEIEMDVPYKEDQMNEPDDEAVDYGYSSVNDISRKYSLESMESVGSIIDLVGNLSASSSSQTSHIYTAADLLRNQDDITSDDYAGENDITGDNERFVDNYKCENYSTASTMKNASDDVTMEPDDVILHLDEVINSFSIETDQEDDKNDPQTETNNERRSKRNKSRESTIDFEKQKEKRKNKDPEKERERKERRKKKKEEKRAEREQENPNTTEEAYQRDRNIAKHVDKIGALTQDMIQTQSDSQEDAIYAQVEKSKKENIKNSTIKDANDNFETFPDPPYPFSNRPNDGTLDTSIQEPIGKSSRAFWSKMEKESHSETSGIGTNFNCTSTPVESPETRWSKQAPARNSSSDVTDRLVTTPKRFVSDASDYRSNYQPYISKNTPQFSGRLMVNTSMLQESSKGLKHVDMEAPKGKVFEINPNKNQIKEIKVIKQPMIQENSNSPKPITKQFPKKDPVPVPPVKHNFYRRPKNADYAPPRGRPISLNLDESGNLTAFTSSESRSTVIKPYSSFREDKTEPTKRGSQADSKPKPFVITSIKKPIQLY